MTDDTDIDGLAAEYVLGSLSVGERTEVQSRLSSDTILATAVARWERRLAPLSHREPGIAPPTDALAAILARIAQQVAAGSSRDTIIAIDRRARFWRRATFAMAAMLALFAVGLGGLIYGRLWDTSDTLVAILDRQSSNPAADEPELAVGPLFLATLHVRSQSLNIRQLAGRRPPSGKTYAIWIVDGSGTDAVWLGSIDGRSRSLRLQLPGRAIDARVRRKLAISVENDGVTRSPTGAFISVGSFDVTTK